MNVQFTLQMDSMIEISFMVTPFYGHMLYKDYDEFLEHFWQNAHRHLQLYLAHLRAEDYWSVIREGIDGVRYLVWARIIPTAFPAVMIRYDAVEERDRSRHPGEHYHRAG